MDTPIDPNAMVEMPPNSTPTIFKKKVKKKKKNKHPIEISDDPQQPSSSSSSLSSCCTSTKKFRVSSSKRNPRILIGSARQKESDVEAIALPLGMSIAAVVAQVLERNNAVGERIAVDHLSMMCTSAVRESLANVFGDKFDCFTSNFEKSFRTTLKTLRSINELSLSNGEQNLRHSNRENLSDRAPSKSLISEEASTYNSGAGDFQSEINRELVLHHGQLNNQLSCLSQNTRQSSMNQSMLSTIEKSVIEQVRSNDLKTFEMGLMMQKLKLKETQLGLSSDLNRLERFKLSMGISKATFRAEKFKNELEETRHAELIKKCIDCLVAGLVIMLMFLGYGTYVYSHQRITQATASCTPSKDSKSSWWMPNPMSSFNSGLQVLTCQIQVISRMLFGALMILTIAYLLLTRATTPKQTMPVTFILLLLGVACGFCGKLCIDTLGGSGYRWLFYWETLCLLHFFSNICTPTLFIILHGPITVSESSKKSTTLYFPYWIRRVLFYATMLLFLPSLCGFLPFAGFSEWKDHFYSLAADNLPMW